MKPTVQVNTNELNACLREYARVSKKDWADILNAKSLSIVFEALKRTKKADATSIKALESQPWWPKYIARRIKSGFSYRKGKAKINIQGAGYDKSDAKTVSKKIIAARVRAVAFLKSGWIPAINRLWPLVKEKERVVRGADGARQYGADKGSARAAVPGVVSFAEVINSADGIQSFGPDAVYGAISEVMSDTAQYIRRKTLDTARKLAEKEFKKSQ